MRGRALLAAALVLAAFAPTASAAPGDPDPTFGSGGVVRMLPSNEDIFLRGVTTQPDGKVVLAGGDFITKTTIVVRLLANGALDPSFGGDGIVNLALGTENSAAQTLLIQPDGKILLAGSAKGAVNFDFVFARLNSDGSPDLTFGGGDGFELVAVGTKASRVQALALGPGGRIVGTGDAETGAEDAAGVVVLGANGLPDPGYFGGDGITVETTTPKSDDGVAAAMLADGRVLIGDSNGAGGGDGFTLIQLLPLGTRDPAFGGGDGLVEVPAPSVVTAGGRITDFELLADGRILASGYGFEEVPPPVVYESKAAVGRFLADGQLDESFGSAGWFISDFADSAQTIDVTSGGKLVIAGGNTVQSQPLSIDSPALARLEAGGALDPTFGSGGVVLNGITAPFGEAFENAALDSRERTVIVARAYIGDGNTEVVIRRYLGDIAPDGPVSNRAPHALMKKVPKKIKASRLRGFLGTASDPDGEALSRVQVALLKIVPGGAKASAAARKRGPKCLALKNAKAKFKPAKPKGAKGKKRCQPRWLNVKGKAKWSFKLKKNLPPGRYVVYARATDSEGLVETTFSRKAGNRYGFRVLPAD